MSTSTILTLTATGLFLAGCSPGSGGDEQQVQGGAGTDATGSAETAIETAVELDGGSMLGATVVALDPTGTHGPVGHLQVRLDRDPGTAVTVTVSRSAGDADQGIYDATTHTVATSASIDFDAATWDQWQALTLTATADSDGLDTAQYTLTGAGVDGATVSGVIAPLATTTITGTIARSAFQTASAKPWDAHDDIAFTLSWRRIGDGAAARYAGTYSDEDPLNAPPADAHDTGADGNPGRATYAYPAYGFHHDDEFHVLVAKTVVTPRTTTEANLLLLRFASDDPADLTSGAGLLTATDVDRATGTYPIVVSATVADDPGALMALLPLADPPAYPVTTAPLQIARYAGAGGIQVEGQWEIDRNGDLFSGDSFDAEGIDDGDVHGLIVGSSAGLGRPNLLGVHTDAASGAVTVVGLPFYSEGDDSFPFGALGGRRVALSDGTTDRAFLFASFTSSNN